MLKRLLHRPLALALHTALVLILIGAVVTHFWGESGMLSLRVGDASSTAVRSDGSTMQLPFTVQLQRFSVKTYPDGKTHRNYISRVRINNNEDVRIAMNHPHSRQGYSLLQMTYDSDLGGSTLLVQHDPWGVGITFCGYWLLFGAGACLLVQHGWRQRRNRTFWVCVGLSVLGASGYLIHKLGFAGAPLMPVLRSPFLIIHVSIIIAAYMLMICMLFVRDRSLLLPAVLLLAAGIFIGAMWANISWGRYWGWDPKETWALITLLIYSVPVHSASLRVFRRPMVYHTYVRLAFLSVIITYFGVNYLLGGLHSYA